MYLESIFIGGDIRSQLPDEAKKFDNIDRVFKRASDWLLFWSTEEDRDLRYFHLFMYVFIHGLSHSIQKFPGQGLTLSHLSDNPQSLTTGPPGNS